MIARVAGNPAGARLARRTLRESATRKWRHKPLKWLNGLGNGAAGSQGAGRIDQANSVELRHDHREPCMVAPASICSALA
jgi:hypothetical protein